MSLKDRIIENEYKRCCINCNNYERLNTKNNPSYCKKTDKLILEMHIDCIRICENFERKVEND